MQMIQCVLNALLWTPRSPPDHALCSTSGWDASHLGALCLFLLWDLGVEEGVCLIWCHVGCRGVELLHNPPSRGADSPL